MTKPTPEQIASREQAGTGSWIFDPLNDRWVPIGSITFVEPGTIPEGKPPHFWSGAEDVRIATIDECAKVADKLGKYSNGEWIDLNCEAIAAAIRALKDKP